MRGRFSSARTCEQLLCSAHPAILILPRFLYLVFSARARAGTDTNGSLLRVCFDDTPRVVTGHQK